MDTTREVINAEKADYYRVDLAEGTTWFESDRWAEAARFAWENNAEVIVSYGPKSNDHRYVGEFGSDIIEYRPKFSDYALAMGFDN